LKHEIKKKKITKVKNRKKERETVGTGKADLPHKAR
jgi:hypothetical protein